MMGSERSKSPVLRAAGALGVAAVLVALSCAPGDHHGGGEKAAEHLAGAPAATARGVEHFPVQGKLALPFSEAVRVGELLILSGVIGTPGATYEVESVGELKLVPGGIEAESRQVMENIREVLERNGSSLDRVVKCTVMLADISEWGTFNGVYVEYFDEPYPARSALGANGLALGARVEVECWAAVG